MPINVKPLHLHIIYILVLLVIIGVEFSYRTALYNYSITAIKSIQSNSTAAGIWVFEFISDVGNGALYYIIFLFFFNWQSRARSYYHILFLTSSLFVMNLTKMAYHEPRPFFVDKDINVYGCSAEYGNPSGHSLFAAAYCFFLFLDIFESPDTREQRRFTWPYFLSLFFAVSITVLVGFARLYVGVHSLNQIFFGWQLGLWLAFYFHFCIREEIMEHIKFITEYEKNTGQNNIRYIMIASAIFLITFMAQICTYIIIENVFTPDSNWELLIYEKCPSIVPGSGEIFNDKSVIMSGLSTFSYTAYLGLITHRKIFGKMYPNTLKTTLLKSCLRLLVLVIVALPFAVPFLVTIEAHIAVLVIVKSLIPCLCLGYVIFGFVFFFYKKFKLINEETPCVDEEDSGKGEVLLQRLGSIQ